MLLNDPYHLLNTPYTTPECTPIPQNALKLSRKVDECKPLVPTSMCALTRFQSHDAMPMLSFSFCLAPPEAKEAATEGLVLPPLLAPRPRAPMPRWGDVAPGLMPFSVDPGVTKPPPMPPPLFSVDGLGLPGIAEASTRLCSFMDVGTDRPAGRDEDGKFFRPSPSPPLSSDSLLLGERRPPEVLAAVGGCIASRLEVSSRCDVAACVLGEMGD
jgi:hypothetical protein